MERTWAEMLADGLIPDSFTFTHLIEGLGRAGRIRDAVDVFDKMEEKGCLPDAIIYVTMICNFISVGHLEKCLKYYKDMFRRVADALELFDEMLSRGIRASTSMITSFIELICSYGPPHAAMLVYKKSKTTGCRISLKANKLLLMWLSRFGKCGIMLSGRRCKNAGRLAARQCCPCSRESPRKGLFLGKIIYSKLNNKLLEMNKVKEAFVSANTQRFWRSNGWH
ncbi:hypothetical protein Taro_034550, partial [Colocasia esculenta]|nr:hypothetical protein [Colocasia esculenta]